MNTTLAQLLAIAATMIVMDAVWLTARAAPSRTMIAALQGSPLSVRWAPAAGVYALMIAGLWYFVVRETKDWMSAAQKGAALGAVVYGVYDLTNYATLTKWSLPYALADWVWGAVLFGVTAAVAVAASA